MLSSDLLKLLCCPRCKGDLTYDPAASTLACAACGAVYEVRNDIPILLAGDDH